MSLSKSGLKLLCFRDLLMTFLYHIFRTGFKFSAETKAEFTRSTSPLFNVCVLHAACCRDAALECQDIIGIRPLERFCNYFR